MGDKELKQLVQASEYIVFFGGAGVSTESGIPDYRSDDGLYKQKYNHPPEVMLSHSFFMAHTDEFYAFYRDKMLYPDAQPNAAHAALAGMERQGRLKAVVTQNIDGLHQRAGSCNVLELHGSVHRNYCMRCRAGYSLEDILRAEGVPVCECGGLIRPDVVLYGESLDEAVMGSAAEHIARADMVIVGGTSLNVYPAAGLLQYYGGDRLVLINKTPTPMDRQADLLIQGSIGEVFSGL